MDDTTRYSNTSDDAGAGRGRESPPGIPRWVKVSLIIAVVVVLLVAIIALTGVGGPHGPGRHLPGGHQPSGGLTPPVAQVVQLA